MVFGELPLHDAVLTDIHVNWGASRCTFLVNPVGLGGRALVFEGLTYLEAPKQEPWGPSRSINALQETKPGEFEIEFQSGDVLRVRAKNWTFTAGETA